jgi:hypothetical protein
VTEQHVARVMTPEVIDELRTQTGYNPRQRQATALRLVLIVVQGFMLGQTLRFSSLRAMFHQRFGAIRPRAFQLRFKSDRRGRVLPRRLRARGAHHRGLEQGSPRGAARGVRRCACLRRDLAARSAPRT